MPVDLGPSSTADNLPNDPLPENVWLEPMPDGRVLPSDGDPAEVAAARETLRLAFVAALQHLPARQRAVLILREALHWKASEVAELLDTTVVSVNSALQRARAALASVEITESDRLEPEDDDQRALLARYVDAFESYDMDSLVTLLHEDATLQMPPLELWLRGSDQILTWFTGHGCGCRGSRLVPVNANGAPSFAQYRPAPDGGHEPWALQVLDISDGRIVRINSFLDTQRLFPLFGLPARL
jgi:RNA polymerase sigma-70 factor (ECF subfamily)